jgi:small subunit ribosomal protein S2
VTEAAKRAGLPYLTNRWVGGFITNWEAVKSNIEKVNRMKSEQLDGSWKKFPKHEQVKLEKDLKKLLMVYGGVVELTKLPDAFFMVDIKTENNCLKETQRKSLPVIAIVDTNADPNNVEYPIPANDDAVGSIQHLINYIADAYIEGREIREKLEGKAEKKKINSQQITENKEEIKEIKAEIKTVENKEVKPEVKPEKKKDEEKTSEVEVKEEKKEVIKVKKSTKSQKPKSK